MQHLTLERRHRSAARNRQMHWRPQPRAWVSIMLGGVHTGDHPAMDTRQDQVPAHARQTHHTMGVRNQLTSLDQPLDVAPLRPIRMQVPYPNGAMTSPYPRQNVVLILSHSPRLPLASSVTPTPPTSSVDSPCTNRACGRRWSSAERMSGSGRNGPLVRTGPARIVGMTPVAIRRQRGRRQFLPILNSLPVKRSGVPGQKTGDPASGVSRCVRR